MLLTGFTGIRGVDANSYIELLNQIRKQRGWSWSELARRIDIGDVVLNPPAPYVPQSVDYDSYLDDDVIVAEIIESSGLGVNPLAVVVDVVTSGDIGRAEIYRPVYDEKDALGRMIHYCPITGVELLRSCGHCGASLPRKLDLHTRFCAICGGNLPFSVTMSDVQLHNYWVIYRTSHSGIQLKRFKNFTPSHPARQILTSPYPTLKLNLHGQTTRLFIVWRGAGRVEPQAA